MGKKTFIIILRTLFLKIEKSGGFFFLRMPPNVSIVIQNAKLSNTYFSVVPRYNLRETYYRLTIGVTFLYQRTLQGLGMLLRLFVVHIQNHQRHGKSTCKHHLCHESMEDTKYTLLLLIKTTKDMLGFSNKPGYPVSGKSNVN